MKKQLEFTKRQMQFVRKVEKAMQEAHRHGIGFWDNYGHLTAYNARLITLPVPKEVKDLTEEDIQLGDFDEVVHDLNVKNFKAGNADDPLYYTIK